MTATLNESGRSATGGAVGRISRVTGPVIDAEFPADAMPEIYNALTVEVELSGKKSTITFETAQHLGENMVRAIAMQSTDG
ncbi:MAG: F0F1 ATP synthase subunit beta, partial [Yaniella sp.]|nr:F0F1 ATP synthase subunit beta [Yaniella sp.]